MYRCTTYVTNLFVKCNLFVKWQLYFYQQLNNLNKLSKDEFKVYVHNFNNIS